MQQCGQNKQTKKTEDSIKYNKWIVEYFFQVNYRFVIQGLNNSSEVKSSLFKRLLQWKMLLCWFCMQCVALFFNIKSSTHRHPHGHTQILMIYVAAVRGPHWFVMLTKRTISVSVGVLTQEKHKSGDKKKKAVTDSKLKTFTTRVHLCNHYCALTCRFEERHM